MDKLINVAIMILNYNTYELTKRCVDSCLRQNRVDGHSIVIVDNGSTDDSLLQLKKTFSNKINYLENGYNYGFAKGNNLAVAWANNNGFEYTFLLNSDTELVGESLVESLLAIIENNLNCSIIAPNVFNVTANGLDLNQSDSQYLKLLRIFGILPKRKKINNNLRDVSEVHGSAMLVRNKDFLLVGGFPQHYFMYGEESTLAKKLLWQKKRLLRYSNEKLYILHHHDKSKTVDEWRMVLMGRNRALEYYRYRHHWPVSWRIVFLIFMFSRKIHYKKYSSFLKGVEIARKDKANNLSDKELEKQAENIRANYSVL